MKAAWVRGIAVFIVALLTLQGTAVRAQEAGAEFGCGPERALSPSMPSTIGPDVVELQERLVSLGYGPLAIDGVYGPKTIQAVQRFQRDQSLAADGLVGAMTWNALADDSVSVAQDGGTTEKPTGELSIVVDTNRLTLTLYADGEVFKTYRVAVGRPNQFNLSPVGEWRIIQKDRNWGGGFGTRWLGLNVPWGIYGIHGTNKPWSIGTRASAGCIRMHNRDVEELYSWVSVGTRVMITGVEPDVSFNRRLTVGISGRDVVFVQLRLQELGFNAQGADGRFGPNTADAVKELQRLYGLPIDGEVYDDVYYILGLK